MTRVNAKQRVLPIEWTDVLIENVPVVSATPLETLTARRFAQFMRRGNYNHATRSAAKQPRHMVQVLAQVS